MYPKISVVIPAHNEEQNFKRLLPSLEKQQYPKGCLEYIVVNDDSNDGTNELAETFGARVISVKTHDIELNKGIGMHVASGEFVYWLDADMEIFGNNFFELLVQPLQDNPALLGSFTKEFALDGCDANVLPALLRFISYNPLQQDPLYQFFSPSIDETIVEQKSDFCVCRFFPGRIPAVGRIMYRRAELIKTAVGNNKSFVDLESVEIVARAGYEFFAYVPQAKIRHYHATTLTQLVHKRLRNLENDYLPNVGNKYYLWFNPNDPKDILKIGGWVLYANLFIPEFIRGLVKAIKFRDYAFFWQPIVSIATTDAIVFGFLKKSSGRKFILQLLKQLLMALFR